MNLVLKYQKELAQIEKLTSKLALTDYLAIKFAEGEITQEEYAPIKKQRRAWRDEINAIQATMR